MDAQELQDPEKILTIWVKNLNSIVNKMSDWHDNWHEAKKAIKLDIVEIDKSETYPEEELSPKDGLYRYLHQHGEQHGDK